jgi:parallel beta-helix repeat protein
MENFHERVAALKQQTAHLPHHTQVLARSPMQRLTSRLCALRALGLVVGWITPAAGQAISCGATLGPGGQFLLEANLDCGTVSPALTVRDGAQLDLGGHTIRTFSAEGSVILMEGHGAVVTNGIVLNDTSLFADDGIEVAGDGGHTVHRVSVFAGRFGILVTSAHNELSNNVFTSRIGSAVAISGDQNRLTSNWTTGGQAGFIVGGDGNRLVENSTTETETGFDISGNQNLLTRNNAANLFFRGFAVSGGGNTLVGNLALNTAVAGISVSGQETVIVGNTALNNSTDLLDTHEDCGNNRWQRNVFRTSQAGSTENPACIQGQPAQGRNVAQNP